METRNQQAPRTPADQEAESPPAPDYSEDGIDLSLVRRMLALTPAARLAILENHLRDILAIRERNARR